MVAKSHIAIAGREMSRKLRCDVVWFSNIHTKHRSIRWYDKYDDDVEWKCGNDEKLYVTPATSNSAKGRNTTNFVRQCKHNTQHNTMGRKLKLVSHIYSWVKLILSLSKLRRKYLEGNAMFHDVLCDTLLRIKFINNLGPLVSGWFTYCISSAIISSNVLANFHAQLTH